jgi:two-component system chemotaxis response regulator CheB
MGNHPVPVLVLSGRSEMVNVFKALELGAVDFLAKPKEISSFAILKLEHDLVTKTEAAALVPPHKLQARLRRPDAAELRPAPRPAPALAGANSRVRVLAIGASTGGPPAVHSIIGRLPADFPAVVLVAQHMPPDFTTFFAERLNRNAQLPVTEARAGDSVAPGRVLIAPGGYHMELRRSAAGWQIGLRERADPDKYVPSVDVLMSSVGEAFGAEALGVILTGMGYDGREGLRRLKTLGGATLAESEETAVVFGMPREAIQAGVIDKVLPLYDIADEILERCRAE